MFELNGIILYRTPVNDFLRRAYLEHSIEAPIDLTHLPLVPHICVSELLGPHWFS